ncbi:cytochrome P450 [Spinellus fusiger]|nr:cytochrome P450 [Spinellus fusiger]
MEKKIYSLHIALKDSVDDGKNKQTIQFTKDTHLDDLRSLVAEKLSILAPHHEIILLDSKENILDGITEICNQQKVYVDLVGSIKHIIPGPDNLLFFGSLFEMLPNMVESWGRQFANHGPVVSVTLFGSQTVGTNHPEIAELFVKESEYFTKKVERTHLAEAKPFGSQGLFTTNTEDEDWKLAHQLLIPAFSARAVKAYQEEMSEVTRKVIKVFDQFPPDRPVDMIEWATNIAFETVGRIGFGYSFGMLENPDTPMHPFIEAMGYCLSQMIVRLQQPQFMKNFPTEANRRFNHSVKLMQQIVDEVVQERKDNLSPVDKCKDLLDFMLYARNENNEGLSYSNIRDQVITFLIAGHETTATTIEWVMYEIATHPDVEAKIVQEIVNVGINSVDSPTNEQISGLKYLHQAIKETLRKYPPLRMLSKHCKKDCILPGGYSVKKDTVVGVHVYSLHHNPDIYPNPSHWNPDRWTPEEEQKRSRFSWLPFSTGPRACVGMAIAIQEIKTLMSMLLHKFHIHYEGPPVHYNPKTPSTKPYKLNMFIHPRTNLPCANVPLNTLSTKAPSISIPMMPQINPGESLIALPKVTFLYGSQTGTAEDYATQLYRQAQNFGFKDIELYEMDKWKVLDSGKYEGPKGETEARELVVICSATYNGLPPDNAERFNRFLSKTKDASSQSCLSGLMFTIFGLGNKNWRTYQQFPLKINSSLEELGAERFFAFGEGNADEDIDSKFDEWYAHFWTYTLDYYGVSVTGRNGIHSLSNTDCNNKASVKIQYIRPSDKDKWQFSKNNCNGDRKAKIVFNEELQTPASDRSTREIHIDISDLVPVNNNHFYEAGDHLEIMPENSPEMVEAVAMSFGWALDSIFEIDPTSLENASPRSLAASIHGPCTIRNALACYADLSAPPSRYMIACFSDHLHKTAPEIAEEFDMLTASGTTIEDNYTKFIKTHRTILDLQRAYPQVTYFSFSQFLTATGVIQPRRYSIASSPLAHPREAHLTVGVLGDIINDTYYEGLCSSYLSRANSIFIRAAIKSSKGFFELPEDPATPIIMIASGTGLAPFRGFLQERAHQLAQGIHVGSCTLFFGCRHPDTDYIYSNELQEYMDSGVLKNLYVAFSRKSPQSATKYVQHQLLANSYDIWNLIMPDANTDIQPAHVFTCGSHSMNEGIRRTFYNLAVHFGEAQTEEQAETVLQTWIDEKRYNEDVWGIKKAV